MKKLLLLAALAGAVGCTSTTAERQWAADEPPPLAAGTKPVAAAPEVDPSKLPPALSKVSAEDIDDQNYRDQARRLESEIKVQGRAMTQAGR
jgi:hypothetical protein